MAKVNFKKYYTIYKNFSIKDFPALTTCYDWNTLELFHVIRMIKAQAKKEETPHTVSWELHNYVEFLEAFYSYIVAKDNFRHQLLNALDNQEPHIHI